jgi:hypothetical protein
MKRSIMTAALMVPIAVALGLGGCLLEDRTVEIVLAEENCVSFPEDRTTENFTTPDTIWIGDDLDELLLDNEVSRDQITSAHLVSGAYEITDFPPHPHNWVLEGVIMVQRLDITEAADTLIRYSDVSLEDELGIHTPVDLHEDGVAVINRALDDYLAGTHLPILVVSVVNGDVDPSPSAADHMIFTWDACITLQVVAEVDLEILNWIGGGGGS